MKEILYHGSDHLIKEPVFHGGKKHNDYGYGFYCTESLELAKEWAVSPQNDGFANQYEITSDGLKILELNKQYGILTWLAILTLNRHFELDSPIAKEAFRYIQKEFQIDVDPYDIVIGYRADDSYFSFAQDFLNNTISLEQLSSAMRLGNLGEQVVLRSRESYNRIRFICAEEALRKDWLALKEERDNKARHAYFHSDRMQFRRGELYIMEILDKEMKADDTRIQRVVFK